MHTLPNLERTILPCSRQTGCIQGWVSISLLLSGSKITRGREGRKNPLAFSQQTINRQSWAQGPAPVFVELFPFPFPFAFQTKEDQSPLLNNATAWCLGRSSERQETQVQVLDLSQAEHKHRIQITHFLQHNTLTSPLRFHCFWPAEPLKKTLANLAPAITTGAFCWGFWCFVPPHPQRIAIFSAGVWNRVLGHTGMALAGLVSAPQYCCRNALMCSYKLCMC